MWKDTVMDEGQIIQTLKGCRERHPLRVGWEVEMEIAEAQAEISFKAGQDEIDGLATITFMDGAQAGRREVVEEARKNGIEFIPEKLKEWGIK